MTTRRLRKQIDENGLREYLNEQVDDRLAQEWIDEFHRVNFRAYNELTGSASVKMMEEAIEEFLDENGFNEEDFEDEVGDTISGYASKAVEALADDLYDNWQMYIGRIFN